MGRERYWIGQAMREARVLLDDRFQLTTPVIIPRELPSYVLEHFELYEDLREQGLLNLVKHARDVSEDSQELETRLRA